MAALLSVTKTAMPRLGQKVWTRSAIRTPFRGLSSYIHLSPRVKEALNNREPLVALESTIISHGMPYPQNVETARAVEQIVSDNGSVPATIALMNGKIHIGLTSDELEVLGHSGRLAVKTSRRDMGVVLSQKLLGATTVSATMIAAHLAGIRIFATGGIGGVHRGAESTMDVSADLTELGKTPVTVVCAGAKSILDLPKTLEYLETQGVPIIAYGESNEFPAFFSPRSGLKTPWNLRTPEEVARVTKTNIDLGLNVGAVVAVPIPDEFAGCASEIENAIEVAVREATEQNVKGKESTPFLLKKVVELTGGASLKANIGLVKNNASVGSKIAKSLAEMRFPSIYQRGYSTSTRNSPHDPKTVEHKERPVLVVGGSAIDVTSRLDKSLKSASLSASSYPGSVQTSVGGVGQNIARASHFLGADTVLVSAIGHDVYGDMIRSDFEKIGMDTSFLQYPGNDSRTAVYNAIHGPTGDLIIAAADMSINGMVSPQQIEDTFHKLKPGYIGIDGNISILAMANTVLHARTYKSCTVFEPTSIPKCTSMINALSFIKRSGAVDDLSNLVHIITPNHYELEKMADVAHELAVVESIPLSQTVDEIADTHYTLHRETIRDALTLSAIFPIQIIKLSEKGVMLVSPSPRGSAKPLIRHIQPLKPSLVVNSNGAGDSMVGALLALLQKHSVRLAEDRSVSVSPTMLDDMVMRAQRASIMSLESPIAISNELSPSLLDG